VIDGVTNSSAATTAISGAVKGGEMGKQEFLQLLVTQLRHQDPLNPADPQEFASQLAQFSTLEQLIGIGTKLDDGAAATEALMQMQNNSSALTLIGKNIVAEGGGVSVGEGAEETKVQVAVGGAGGSGVVRLYDAAGEEVASLPVGQLEPGRQTIDITQLGLTAGPGQYRYELEVTDASGESVETMTFTETRVDGVQYTQDGPMLVCGSQTIALNAVVEISG
jgi:flagellar basal-body rod modification protein FlgD